MNPADRPRELELKQPARAHTIPLNLAIPRRREVLEGSTESITRELYQLERSGQLVTAGRLTGTGRYRVDRTGRSVPLLQITVVLRDKPQVKTPLLARVSLALGLVLLAASLLAGMLIWLLQTLSSVPVLAIMGVALLVLLVLCARGRVPRMGGKAEVTSTTSISIK